MAHPSVLDYLYPSLPIYNPTRFVHRPPILPNQIVDPPIFSEPWFIRNPSIPKAPPIPVPSYVAPFDDVIVLENGREIPESIFTSSDQPITPTLKWIDQARQTQYRQQIPNTLKRLFDSNAPRPLPTHALGDDHLTAYEAITSLAVRLYPSQQTVPNSNDHLGLRPFIEYFLFRIDTFLRNDDDGRLSKQVETFPHSVTHNLNFLHKNILLLLNPPQAEADNVAAHLDLREILNNISLSAQVVVKFLYPNLHNAFFNGIHYTRISEPPYIPADTVTHIPALFIQPTTTPNQPHRENALIAIRRITAQHARPGASWIHEFAPQWSDPLPDGMPFGTLLFRLATLILTHQQDHAALEFLFFLHATHSILDIDPIVYPAPVHPSFYDNEPVFPSLIGAPSIVTSAHKALPTIIAELRILTWQSILTKNPLTTIPRLAHILARLTSHIIVLATWRFPQIHIAFFAGIPTIERLIRIDDPNTSHDTHHNFIFPATVSTISDIISAVRATDPAASVSPVLMREIASHLYAPIAPDPSLTLKKDAVLFYSSDIDAFILPIHYSHILNPTSPTFILNALTIPRLKDSPKKEFCINTSSKKPTSAITPNIDAVYLAQLDDITQYIFKKTDINYHAQHLIHNPNRLSECAHILASHTRSKTWSVDLAHSTTFVAKFIKGDECHTITIDTDPKIVSLPHLLYLPHRTQHLILALFAQHASISLSDCRAPQITDIQSNTDTKTPYPSFSIPIADSIPDATTDLVSIHIKDITKRHAPYPFIPQFNAPPSLIATQKFYDAIVLATNTYNACARLVASFRDPLTILQAKSASLYAPISVHIHCVVVSLGPSILQFFKDVAITPNTFSVPHVFDDSLPHPYIQATIDIATDSTAYPLFKALTPAGHPITCIFTRAKSGLSRQNFYKWSRHLHTHLTNIFDPTDTPPHLLYYRIIIVLRVAAFVATDTSIYASINDHTRSIVHRFNDDAPYTDQIYSKRVPFFISTYITSVPHIIDLYT